MPWKNEYTETVRQMIIHESNVTNHRIMWLVTLNGFLFAALGFAWKDGQQLVQVLALLGIATSISTMIPLYCADVAIRNLTNQWDTNKPNNYEGPDIIGYRPVSFWIRIWMPWIFLPGLLTLGWVLVLIFWKIKA